MEKTELTLKVNYIYEYETSYGWNTQTKRKYILKDDFGRVYTWDTTVVLYKDINDSYTYVRQGDRIKLSGYIKGEYEYKGTPQIELTRCKLLEILEHAPTKEELEARKAAEQMASLKDGDFIWRMPYRQYKDHYSDCETVAGSYRTYNDPYHYVPADIAVIIRNGRLKPSGVRGKRFSGYKMENELGEWCTFRAVSEENARKQALKEFPGHAWECVRIFD